MDDQHGSNGTVWAATQRSASEEAERAARSAVLAAVHRRGLAVIVLDDSEEVRRCCRDWTAETFAGAWPFLHLFLASDRATAAAPAGEGAAFLEEQVLPAWPLPRTHWHAMPLGATAADAPARLERTLRMVCELPPPARPRFDLLLASAARVETWPASPGGLIRWLPGGQSHGLTMSADLLLASRRVVLFDGPSDAEEIRWTDRRRLFGSSESTVRILVRPADLVRED